MKLTNTISVRIKRLIFASRTFRLGTSGLQSSVKPTRWSTALDQISQSLCNKINYASYRHPNVVNGMKVCAGYLEV